MVTPPGPAVAGVTYHTGITAETLVRLYQFAWVYASPSTYEGFGLPYVEAMACGTPVVATPNPGSQEVLGGGQFGRLVADAMFADTVRRLLVDPGERTRIARAGLTRAAEYDIACSAALYEGVIREMVTIEEGESKDLRI
jgi:glycosyltransferase involved in cell wall biosynthesis